MSRWPESTLRFLHRPRARSWSWAACSFSALTSGLLPPETRTAGLALLGTSMALAGLAGSVMFGALWTALGLQPAVVAFLVGLTLAVALLAAGLAWTARR